MKKILFLLALASGILASCDMDKKPYDSIPDTEALTTPSDFKNMRVGLYSGLRSSVGGTTFYNTPEIQSDCFHAVVGFSNTYGDMYRWTFTSATSEFATVYGNYQSLISRANFIIDGYNKCDMSNSIIFTPAEKANVDVIKGEAFFTRAYSIFGLAQYFCADYDAATANNEQSGVSYRLDYAPSSSNSTYPKRYTLAETYSQIEEDLDSAAKYIQAVGVPCNDRMSKDAITALRARVALAKDDYAKAAQLAESLITDGTYTLASTQDELIDLWQNDGGDETIFQLAIASKDELPAATGTYYQPFSVGGTPDYLPTKTLTDLYDRNDIRKPVYFNVLTLNTVNGSTGTVYGFNKYIDHGRVWNDFNKIEDARFVIEPKMFRIAEMYLIAAEAYAQNNQLDKANTYLKELKEARISGYQHENIANPQAFMNELKNERTREMVTEGTRLFDLKRWHDDMKRGEPQQTDLCLLPGQATTQLVKSANDPKFVWPIPKHETDANPNIKQNPGY